jgi:hypothetical protein
MHPYVVRACYNLFHPPDLIVLIKRRTKLKQHCHAVSSAYRPQDMIRRSAVLKADCANPSEPRHTPYVPLLGRYLAHVLWKVAVLVFLYELTGACFSVLHFEQVKKIYLSCIPQLPPQTPRPRFCANFHFGSWKYLILPNSAPTVRRHDSTGHNAQRLSQR